MMLRVDGAFSGAGFSTSPRTVASRPCLLEGVLDQRLVDDRQHFLRDRLGRRQETRAESADRKYSFAYRLVHQPVFPRKLWRSDRGQNETEGVNGMTPGLVPGGAV